MYVSVCHSYAFLTSGNLKFYSVRWMRSRHIHTHSSIVSVKLKFIFGPSGWPIEISATHVFIHLKFTENFHKENWAPHTLFPRNTYLRILSIHSFHWCVQCECICVFSFRFHSLFSVLFPIFLTHWLLSFSQCIIHRHGTTRPNSAYLCASDVYVRIPMNSGKKEQRPKNCVQPNGITSVKECVCV